MSSTGSKYYSSKYPVSVVNDRSPSTSTYSTMSSRGTYSGSGTSSDYSSSRDSSPNVRRETYRAFTSKDYKGDSATRNNRYGDVTVLNHHSRCHDQNDPHPEYRTSKTDRKESKKSTRP